MNAIVAVNTASSLGVTSSISALALQILSAGAVPLATGRRSASWSLIRLGQICRRLLESGDNYLDTHRRYKPLLGLNGSSKHLCREYTLGFSTAGSPGVGYSISWPPRPIEL